MIILLFISIMGGLSLLDIKYYYIPNAIVLPAILVGGLLTGNWIMAVVMFLVGVLFYNRKKICGGDVKLLAMVGAFLGIWALPAFLLSKLMIHIFRVIDDYNDVLPYTPFISIASSPFLFVITGNSLSQKWF